MSIEDLSSDRHQAIDFATSEFARGTVFWPRLLVRCLEAKMAGNALSVAERLYARRCSMERDGRTESWLNELRYSDSVDLAAESHRLHIRAREIWNDPCCRSLTCRGVTRLFDAKAELFINNYNQYEIEITRALSMLASRNDVQLNITEFDMILTSIIEELDR